jgi:hypothetical protein
MRGMKGAPWLALGILGLVSLLSCSKSTCPSRQPTFPEPLDRVATNITLSIYSDGSGDLIETRTMPREGPLTIDVEDPNPYFNPPRYYLYARAESFYAELYTCEQGETIIIDLDGVPQCCNAITGVIFAVQDFFADCYYADGKVKVFGPEGIVTTIRTDQQGRYGLQEMPPGAYRLTIWRSGLCFPFDLTNGGGTDYEDLSFQEPWEVFAPNLYLYPEAEREVTVAVSFPAGGIMTESEPPYGGGWQVRVTPEGVINGRYDYLFYEALVSVPMEYKSGWLLNGDDLEGELRTLLERLGFVGREIDDFVDYWVPLLDGSPYYAVYPQKAESMITLDIAPAPGSVLRALFFIRPLQRRLSIPAPPMPDPFVRDGFTAVEWGVVGWCGHPSDGNI